MKPLSTQSASNLLQLITKTTVLKTVQPQDDTNNSHNNNDKKIFYKHGSEEKPAEK